MIEIDGQIDADETLERIAAMRKKLIDVESSIVEEGQWKLNRLAKQTVLGGTVPGFGMDTGKTMAEGLFQTLHVGKFNLKTGTYRSGGKTGVIGTSWHPLANAFENFKRRPQVKWLAALSKDFKGSGVMQKLAEDCVNAVAEAGGGE